MKKLTEFPIDCLASFQLIHGEIDVSKHTVQQRAATNRQTNTLSALHHVVPSLKVTEQHSDIRHHLSVPHSTQ